MIAVVIDPPWGADQGGGRRGANTHYPLVTPRMMPLVVRSSGLWPDDGDVLCFLWATTSALMLGHAHGLCSALAIKPVAGFVWAKTQTPPDITGHTKPASRMGMGQWSRCEHEHLLVCRRGQMRRPPLKHRSIIYAPRTTHSTKPAAAWAVIESITNQQRDVTRRVEIFARQPRDGWLGWGHDLVTEAINPEDTP